MKDLLPHYEAELALLRRLCRGFAERYPGVAGSLLMNGDTCDDPHVERLIQASALLAARISKRLDDDYSLFTESLLEMLYPHYLRSFPSCSIVHLDFGPSSVELPEIVTLVPRGTLFKSPPVQGVKCKFRSASDLIIAPIAISDLQFNPIINAPTSVRLNAGATSSIDITFSKSGRSTLTDLSLKHLRLFLDAEPTLAAALRDTLFTRVHAAYISFPRINHWHALADTPLQAVGFSEAEALIPFSPRSHPAYRLLTEYFVYPEKFNFIDIMWNDIVAHLPMQSDEFTLHLVVNDAQHGSKLAHILSKLVPRNLLMHCVPVANLFKRSSAPVDIRHTTSDYALLADTVCPEAYEIYGIESASLITDASRRDGIQQLKPFYSIRHGDEQHAGQYWVMRRDDATAELSPGHEMRISLVNAEFKPEQAKNQTLSAQLLCSNRQRATQLKAGLPEGDLHVDGMFTRTPIRLLRQPCKPRRFPAADGAHWRLIAHLTLNHRALSNAGLDEFRQMLTLYNLSGSSGTQRQIDGIVDLHCQNIMAWIPGVPNASLMPGVEVRMTVDEEAFVGSGIHLFAQVLEHFFGLYCQINVFSQLLILSKQTGEEIVRCQPRSGAELLA
ncbi:type VI secretion system baseplate subunit TssF [Duganella levis]|uniref:Type VI secretion system baseplate subunit TssF n=1 Tax=Duganella levis TaxID=2692169 RepID=A0ABW9W6Q1_9BURK|nr:type VI secretion system baseplate subunit TssF [Duganella levis]MYN29382.1 type VI secretion system baseplate subunit TssF [Duganella levis]